MRLTLLLDMAADGFGDRVLAGRRTGGITAAELARRSHAGAALLRERAADALVYLDVNGPAFPVALFAAARAGVPLVPLNYRLGQRQLDALLARHPKALGIAGPGALAHFERAGIDAMTADAWLEQTRAGRGGVSVAGPAANRATSGEENPVAVVIYTSGTTSEPKGVLLRHENLVSYVLGSVEFASADETEAALVSVPPYHIAAVANVITNLYAGRRTLVLEAFTPGEWLRTVREEEVTSAMVVPTMLARIIDGEEDRSVPSLRSLSYGGAPMPAALIERALREWTGVGFVNAYGLTETSSTVALLGPEDHRAAIASPDPAVRARLSSVGQPLPGIELEIRGPGGEVLGAGRGPDLRARRPGVGRVRGPGPGGRRPRLLRHQGRGLPRRRRATCSSAGAPTTRSSAGPRTSPPPRSRTSCCGTRRCSTRWCSACPTPSGGSGSRRPWSPARRPASTRPSCATSPCGHCGRARPRTVSGCSTRCRGPRPASCCAAWCPAW